MTDAISSILSQIRAHEMRTRGATGDVPAGNAIGPLGSGATGGVTGAAAPGFQQTLAKAVEQFLGDVEWGKLDFLVVDLPPGTGDAQLSLVQSVHVSAALIVTTSSCSRRFSSLTGIRAPRTRIIG